MKPNRLHRLRSALARVSTCKSQAASFVLTGIAGILIVWSLAADGNPLTRSSGATSPPSSPGNVVRPSPIPQGRFQGKARTTSRGPIRTKEQHQDNSQWHIAFSTASTIVDPIKREEALARLCYERAESHPREALELAIEHGLEGSPGMIANLAQQWAAVDLPSARAWAESQPEGPMREDLFARIGYVWSLSDPAAAARFVSSSNAPGDSQTEAAISILHQWRKHDPTAARAWVECFPEGPTRERALHETDGPRADLPDE